MMAWLPGRYHENSTKAQNRTLPATLAMGTGIVSSSTRQRSVVSLNMSRRRYLSTDISTDGKVNQLSDQAALLFTWSIPHFADDCRLTPQNAAELRMAIVPGRSWNIKHVEGLMNEIFSFGLWGKDENGRIFIPADSFYKFQTYINAANRRETPQIAASPSPSPSPSFKGDSCKRKYPADFAADQTIKDLAVKNGWPDPDTELEAFRDYHVSKGSRFLDWNAAFRTWLRNGRRINGQSKTKAEVQQQRTQEFFNRRLTK